MGNLSHIDDVEKRSEDVEEEQMLEAQQALIDARRSAEAAEEEAAEEAAAEEAAAEEAARQEAARQEAARQAAAQRAAQQQAAQAQGEERFERFDEEPGQKQAAQQQKVDPKKKRVDLTADQEADFHGLTNPQPMSVPQKVVIVCAVLLIIVAVVYLLNEYFNFF